MAKQTDTAWFAEAFKEHYGELYFTCQCLLEDHHIAEDLTEEVFTVLWSKRKELRTHPYLSGWLYKTMYNMIKNETRRAKYHMELPLSTFSERLETLPEPEPLENFLPPELKAGDRQILILYFEKELSYSEIASELGISVLGCRTRLFRAKRRYLEITEHKK